MFENIEDLIWVNAHTPPIEVTIYLYANPEVGKLESMSKFPVPEFVENGFRELLFISRWSVPTSAEMESYRRQASVFNAQAMSVMVDEPVLSDCVVTHHMRGLSLNGKEIELERSENSSLAVGSLKKLKSMHSGLYDLMYNTYKTEACLLI